MVFQANQGSMYSLYKNAHLSEPMSGRWGISGGSLRKAAQPP